MDHMLIEVEAKELRWLEETNTPRELEAATDSLIGQLTQIVDQTVPHKKPDRGRSIKW